MEFLVVLLLLAVAILWFLLVRRKRQLRDVQGRLEPLLKYEQIVDAEGRASEILSQANEEASRLRTQVQGEVGDARRQASDVVDQAKAEASRVVEAANEEAKRIAGAAWEAAKRAGELEKTVTAMKNVIEGYGDQYIIPAYSLLDELAEEFGYTEAGEALKKARERTRQMIKAGTAADCEYVEANRRVTAIRFVVDAFNGKVDSVLSRTKADNHGKLKQEIVDAFSLVNENGRAFRNARILPEYLEARLDELRWGAVAHELRNKEREEQRQIKERIREEEKARREYEKAMKDAAKEEETLRKAMEKAQKEIEKAGDEQKAKYEEQLRVLSERLKEAEARSQRATSMAQLTKAGHVYVISNIGSFGEEVFKIGMTRRLEPSDRVRELGDASVPFDFDIHAMIYSEDAPGLERDLHKRFLRMQMNKVNPRKEFFKLPLGQIREAVDSSGCQAKWTMTAEARQYRESLALERSLLENTLDEQKWTEEQMKAHDQEQVDALDEASA